MKDGLGLSLVENSRYHQELYSVSQEGRQVVPGRKELSDLTLVKMVRTWLSCQGGKRLGCMERNEHLKQLGWTRWEGGVLGKPEEEVTACLLRNQDALPTPKGTHSS